MRPATARIHPALLALVASSTPLALVVESVARAVLIPPEFEEVRAFLGPSLRTPALLMVPATLALGLVGVLVQRRIVRARAERAPGGGSDAGPVAFLVGSSFVQLPSLAASVLFMFGAPLAPTLLTIGLSVLVVMVQGLLPLAKETER